VGTGTHLAADCSSGAGSLNGPSALLRSVSVARFRFRLATAIALCALFTTLLRAQVSDEEKRKRGEFLIARQEARSDPSPSDEESPTPKPKVAKHKPKTQKSPSPSPTAKPKSKKHKSSDQEKETPKPKPSETPEASPKSTKESEATPRPKSTRKKSAAKKEATPAKKKTAKSKKSPKPKETPEPEKTPKAVKAASPRPAETPEAHAPAALPRGVAVPTATGPPAPTPTIASDAATEEPAQLTIEKSGYERRSGFWYRLFHGSGGGSGSGGAGYRYLTRSVRAEIDRAPADRRNPQWQMIVVHNSGTRQGNARVFDYYHRHVRHMQNGLAYHFVIGNGTSTGNGQIEVGDRWRRQINGGHVHSDHLNNIALGICLVGDFNRDQPTHAQLECCEELIRYLRQRCGKVGSRYMIVRPHRDVNPPRWATDCPGDAFPYSWFRRFQE
jgi:hypothetical protein